MVAFRLYLHPRTWRRKITLFYFRIIAGRAKGEKLPAIETQLLRLFYELAQDPETTLAHYVNGVFLKELLLCKDGVTKRFQLVNDKTRVLYHKTGSTSDLFLGLDVTPKTVLVMNRVFDREFAKMLKVKKEKESIEIRNTLNKI